MVALDSSERRLCDARWGGVSPMCPHCGGLRMAATPAKASRWTKWRCRDCQRRCTVVTGTGLHSTKLTPDDWIAVVELNTPTAARIADEIGVSIVTARRIAALLQPVTSSASDERLQHLLRERTATAPTHDKWQIDPLPATLRPEDSVLPSLGDGTKATLNALRARPFGATAAKLAELSGVSYSQTLRCLADLERRGWAERSASAVPFGYESKSVTLWNLSWSDTCMQALAFLRDIPTRRAADAGDRIPARFWRYFWSGASADTLQISEHGLHIAETLIGGRDPCARAWALATLPTNVLQECRTIRGCDAGLRAELLDGEITRRETTA